MIKCRDNLGYEDGAPDPTIIARISGSMKYRLCQCVGIEPSFVVRLERPAFPKMIVPISHDGPWVECTTCGTWKDLL